MEAHSHESEPMVLLSLSFSQTHSSSLSKSLFNIYFKTFYFHLIRQTCSSSTTVNKFASYSPKNYSSWVGREYHVNRRSAGDFDSPEAVLRRSPQILPCRKMDSRKALCPRKAIHGKESQGSVVSHYEEASPGMSPTTQPQPQHQPNFCVFSSEALAAVDPYIDTYCTHLMIS